MMIPSLILIFYLSGKIVGNVVYYDEHKYAVNIIAMDASYFYSNHYRAQITFAFPREHRHLVTHYPNVKYFYRLWEVTSHHAKQVAQNYITHVPYAKEIFDINVPLNNTLFYFIRIFTITDKINEHMSTLRFFHKRIDSNVNNEIIVTRTYPYATTFTIEIPNYLDGIHLNLSLNTDSRNILSHYVTLYRDDYLIHEKSLNNYQHSYYMRQNINRYQQYEVRVVTVFHNYRVIASEYSSRVFFIVR